MNDFAAFAAALPDHQHDPAFRAALSDWLDEHDRPEEAEDVRECERLAVYRGQVWGAIKTIPSIPFGIRLECTGRMGRAKEKLSFCESPLTGILQVNTPLNMNEAMAIVVYSLLHDLRDYYRYQIRPRPDLAHRLIVHEMVMDLCEFLGWTGYSDLTCPVDCGLRSYVLNPKMDIEDELTRLVVRTRPQSHPEWRPA